ncbi:hypothetical protein [Scytonema sp. PRP1]|uniref:hypothetical protein n=1 Tax=Scytonema sp. PRP1 TaxID=3120513 RepID=UPI002FD77471
MANYRRDKSGLRQQFEKLKQQVSISLTPTAIAILYQTAMLLDLKLPQWGFEVFVWIRQQSYAKHLPIVVLTSYKQLDINRAYALRANSYLFQSMTRFFCNI